MSTLNDSDNINDASASDSEETEGSGDQELAPRSFIETQDQAIEFSSKLIKALDGKVEDHNTANISNKVNNTQLKKVYCEAVKSYDPEKHLFNKNHFGFARVNMFLDMTVGKFPQSLPASGENLSLSDIDVTAAFTLDSDCWASAKEDIQKFNIDYDFNSIDDLYIDIEPEKIEFYWD